MNYISTSFMYDVLFTTISIISVIILSLIILLVINNVYYSNKEKKRKKYNEKFVDIISSYMTGEAVEIERFTDKLEFETFADVADNTMLDFSGEQSKKVHLLLDRLGVVDHYKSKAHAYSKLTRHNAIEKLGYFRMPGLKGFFIDALEREPKDKNKVRILIALSFIADWEILLLVTNRLSEILKKDNQISAKLIEHIYTNIIKSLKEKNMTEQLMVFFQDIKDSPSIPLIIKKDIINACGSMHLSEATKILMDYYYSSNEMEIKAAAVRALGRIGEPEGRDVIINALESDSWVLRLVGAKSALICGPTAKYNLKTLLSDPQYHVRLNAAKSLAGLGDEGLAILKSERDSDNAYIRNTVKYVLDLNLNNIYY